MNIFPVLIVVAIMIQSGYFLTRHIIKEYNKHRTVSAMYAQPQFRGSFRVGLILTALLQVVLMLSLTLLPELLIGQSLWENIQFWQVVFMIGSIGMIILGIYSSEEWPLVHWVAACIYLLATATAALFMGAIIASVSLIGVLMICCVIIWIGFSWYHRDSENKLYIIETAHVLLSHVWIILLAIWQLGIG